MVQFSVLFGGLFGVLCHLTFEPIQFGHRVIQNWFCNILFVGAGLLLPTKRHLFWGVQRKGCCFRKGGWAVCCVYPELFGSSCALSVVQPASLFAAQHERAVGSSCAMRPWTQGWEYALLFGLKEKHGEPGRSQENLPRIATLELEGLKKLKA